jgi:DNA-binding Lrp family transcriptional regulator
MLAYVLMELDSAKEQDIRGALLSLPQVKEVHILFGEWDVICKVELEDPDSLATFVMDHVRSLPGVTLTSTMVVAK